MPTVPDRKLVALSGYTPILLLEINVGFKEHVGAVCAKAEAKVAETAIIDK